MTTEKDETFTVLVKGKPLPSVKADLIHAFLSASIENQCFNIHSENYSPWEFTLESNGDKISIAKVLT